MGYYSRYEVYCRSNEPEKYLGYLREYTRMNEIEEWDGAILSLKCLVSMSCKWYEMVNDMALLSKEYPDELFMVLRLGENANDNFWFHFHNGGMFKYKLSAVRTQLVQECNPLDDDEDYDINV